MTEVVQSSSSTSSYSCSRSPTMSNNSSSYQQHSLLDRKRRRQQNQQQQQQNQQQVDFVGLFVSVFRRSVFGCSSQGRISSSSSSSIMEIGVPTNVRHVAHVTFDSFNGFLGLPLEFQPEVPTTPPSASTTVFGVSTNSMQLSFDKRGNSVPTILLMMQHRLYALEGLQAEGIFRINADNGREEYVRDQLNRGLVTEDVDIHCLAGLIKAWFRELPTGVLDCLSPEEVMQSQTEEECVELSRLLPPTESALLDWAVNLMADVAQFQHLNKMNPRNIAMVFAPNMTHMADPLTALMHAVQVMNFLKTLIEKTLKQRQNSKLDPPLDSSRSSRDPSARSDSHAPLHTILEETNELDHDEDPIVDVDLAAGDNLLVDQQDLYDQEELEEEASYHKKTRAKLCDAEAHKGPTKQVSTNGRSKGSRVVSSV